MTTSAAPRGRQGRDARTGGIVDALVDEGLLGSERREDAVAVVDRVLGTQHAGSAPLRRRFAELAGYLGGVFVVSAAGIFFATQWASLGEGQQVALLAGVAVVLAAAAVAVVALAGGLPAVRAGSEPVQRRLAGVLMLGAAGTAAGAVGLQASYALEPTSDSPPLLAFLTFTALALVGYLLAPTVIGQVGIAGGAFVLVPSSLQYLSGGDVEVVVFGLLVLSLGVGWLLLAEKEVWREVASGRVVGCVLVVVGAQVAVFDQDLRWVGYLALFLVAAAAFGTYVVRRAWPYLATGVVALTLVVPEALTDWTDDSLGPAGVLLVAGVTLLGASLLGLRLRHDTA